MTAQEVKFANFYESTLNGVLASGATSGALTAAPTSNGTSNITVPYYLVVDPDNASNREVIEVTAASGTTLSTIVRDKEGRHSTDPTHADGTVVRMAVVKEMFEDIHDRIDAGPTSIAATIIGDGSISNTEFQHLNNVSGNIQSQIDNITAGTASQTVNITVKVADDGSGSQNVFYFLSGTDGGAGTRSTNFLFKIGFKYYFDLSDSSLSGHNLKFSTTKDGTHGGGSEFTTNVTSSGSPGSANAYIQLEVTPETLGIAGATSKLYYYCSTGGHSGMGGNGEITLYPSSYASVGLVLALGG